MKSRRTKLQDSKSRDPARLLLSCEHGGNDVPAELQALYRSAEARQHLNSHRGHDPGALVAARKLAELLSAPLHYSTISRLVVDLNRSATSADVFSKFICDHDYNVRRRILQKIYHPYRRKMVRDVERHVTASRPVIHLSIHTFTPRYRGSIRKFDIGILFDPARDRERRISEWMIDRLSDAGLRAFANRPYLGVADGLTTTLRTRFANAQYAGIEIEINNRFARLSQRTQWKWCHWLAQAISSLEPPTH